MHSHHTNQRPQGKGGRYHRVSTTRQDTERQVQDIDRWLANSDLTTAQTWEDHESRDKAEQRYNFQQMMGAVRSRAIDWIVIQSIDRLGFKDTYEFFGFIDQFRANGVQLWSASDNVCISHNDDARVLMNAIAGLTSSKEQIEKSQRVQTKRLLKAKLGHYLGGLPPYGMDVLCRSADGQEKWRYVLERSNRRIASKKPDGRNNYITTIRGMLYTPKDTEGLAVKGVPAHNKNEDVMTLLPTIRQDRIDTIKRIFHLLDTEATNCWQIAAKLNSEGVPPVVGDGWTDPKIRHLIFNPVYVGKPTINKKGQPRFSEIQDGQVKRIETRGKVKSRRRDKSEWIMPENPVFQPIIDPEIFDRVTAKLAPKVGSRAPKNEQLYLSGIVHCGKCGKFMFGFSTSRKVKSGEKVITPYYQCQNRNKFGPNNPTCCGFHSTRHDQLEAVIHRFLAERGQSIDEMLRNKGDEIAVEKLAWDGDRKNDEYHILLDKMRDRVIEAIDENPNLPFSLTSFLGLPEFGDQDIGTDDSMIIHAYDHLLELTADKIKEQVAKLEREHDDVTAKVLAVSAPALIEKLNAKAEDIEAKIGVLKERLEPLKERWEEIHEELKLLRQRLADAEVAMNRGSNRAKAQAIRACIQKIEVWHVPGQGKKMALSKVRIVPQIGDSQVVEVASDTLFSNNGTGPHERG